MYDLITKVCIREKALGSENQEIKDPILVSLKMEEGPRAKEEMTLVVEAGKGKEGDFPLEPPQYLGFSSVKPILDF